jgi:hypothetical protein
MEVNKMRTYITVLLGLAIMLVMTACNQNDPASSDENLELSEFVQEQATLGWELNDIVSTVKEVEDVTREPALLPDNDINEYASVLQTGKMAVGLMVTSADQIPEQLYLAKPMVDTLIYYSDNTVTGIRNAIYYDGSTGLVRAYEVKYKFAGWQRMTYDSLAIIIDLNFTPDYGGDDMLESVYRFQLFDTNFFIQEIHSQISVTNFVEQEITGFTATVDSYYKEGRYLAHLKQSVIINPNGTGTVQEDFDFNDGSTMVNSITFNGDHTGSFYRQLRDGTIVSGNFDDVHDNLEGYYNETIDFPSGRYIDKISKSVLVSIILPDSIFNAAFAKAVYFENGRIDTANISVSTQFNQGNKTTELDVLKANGAQGTFQIEENSEMAVLTGEWTTWNDYYIIVAAQYYSDGSGHVYYEVYQPPYQQGDDPIVVVDYYFSPDGSGNGTIAHEGNIYQIIFDGPDQAEVVSGDKSQTINLYQ